MAKSLSIRGLADRAQVAASTLSRWESGHCVPRIPELEAVMLALEMDPSEIRKVLISLDAPRASRAVRKAPESEWTGVSSSIAPSGGALLRAIRLRSGRSVSDIACLLGVATSTVSRWETASAHPSSKRQAELLDLLGATDEERACFAESGVGKVKAQRAEFDSDQYRLALDALESTINSAVGANTELRLFQIESNLWWFSDGHTEARRLLCRAHALHALFLCHWHRFTDAAQQAETALELMTQSFADPQVRLLAARVYARAEVRRGLRTRPDIGLELLRRYLPEAHDSAGRSEILREMADCARLANRLSEAEARGSEALDDARSAHNPHLVAHARYVLGTVFSAREDLITAELCLRAPEKLELSPFVEIERALARARILRTLAREVESHREAAHASKLVDRFALRHYQVQVDALLVAPSLSCQAEQTLKVFGSASPKRRPVAALSY